VKIGGSSVGKVFEAYVNANSIDLLIMGAYRHSRGKEIFKRHLQAPSCTGLARSVLSSERFRKAHM
jgi:hypothetical protein